MKVSLLRCFVFLCLSKRQKWTISDFICIPHLIVFNLVEVHSLRKLVGFTPRNYWYFILTGEVCNHARAHRSYNTTISKNVVGIKENFSSMINKTADSIYQSVFAVDIILRESLKKCPTRVLGTSVNNDDSKLGAIFL